MNHGAGWIVWEESHNQGTRKLLSILPARRSRKDVALFMQQIYVDRFASVDERLSYKKQPNSQPFSVMMDKFGGPIHIGHDPFFVGIYSHKVMLQGNLLEFHYKIAVDDSDPLKPVFEGRHQSLVVDA